ncbi:MAG: hypothetical protein JOY58_06065 [Solirubrobacterales bacterium]|nr:hypothetical protein [Solirubrobacterales bacterium]
MSETRMLEVVQEALNTRGIDDQVVAVGQFFPRGQTGGAFVVAVAGGELGGIAGGIGEAVGDIAGAQAGASEPPMPPRDSCADAGWRLEHGGIRVCGRHPAYPADRPHVPIASAGAHGQGA